MTEEELFVKKEDVDTLPAPSEDEVESIGPSVKPTPEQEAEGGVPANAEHPVTEQASEDMNDEELSESEQNGSKPLTTEQEAVEKMLSQSQVNEIIGRTRAETREKALKGFFDHYGVSDQSELDGIMAKGQGYDTIHEAYLSTLDQLKEANIKLALMDSGIAPEKYEDARLILQGKGMEITPENIATELQTHPEWNKKVEPAQPLLGPTTPEELLDEAAKENSPARTMFSKKGPASTISVLGNEPEPQTETISERDKVKELYGL